jgi:hypothetical protein
VDPVENLNRMIAESPAEPARSPRYRRAGRDRLLDHCGECGSWRFEGCCTTCAIAARRRAEREQLIREIGEQQEADR